MIPGLGRSPGEGNSSRTVELPGEFHRQRNLAGYSPWGHKESNRTEQLSLYIHMGLPRWLSSKESSANAEDVGIIPGWEDPLDEEMATHFSLLAWRIPWTEESGGLQSRGLQRDGTRLTD